MSPDTRAPAGPDAGTPSDAVAIHVGRFDPYSDDDASAVASMHHAYLLEEFDRIGRLSPGTPVSPWLRTYVIRYETTPIGFVSIDLNRYSVELIYVVPEARGKGIAALVLGDLAEECPRPMELKTPLSPAGEGIAHRLGLGLAHPTPEHAAKEERTAEEIRQAIKRRCKHAKTGGNPAKACSRCYRTSLKRYADMVMTRYVEAVRS